MRNPTKEAAAIAHEYMHVASETYNSLTQNSHATAMDESYSDYFAVAYTNQWYSDSEIGEYLDESGGYNYTRNLDNSYTFGVFNTIDLEPNFETSSHDRSVIFSGALWDFRMDGDVSSSDADEVVLESLINLDSSPSFVLGRDALVAAAISSGHSSYVDDIYDAFNAHGIGSAPLPPANIALSGMEDENPVISWDASLGADSYKVYRKKTYYHPTSFSVIGTTSNTSFTDDDIYITNKDNSDDNYEYRVKAVNSYGESGYSQYEQIWGYVLEKPIINPENITKELQSTLPEEFVLDQNFPNPFNPTTTIKYELPEDSYVNISIYNLRGQLVLNLVDNNLKAGYHSVKWNAINQPNGIYIYKMEAGEFTAIRKLTLLK